MFVIVHLAGQAAGICDDWRCRGGGGRDRAREEDEEEEGGEET